MERDYSDIIDLPHHVSEKRPQMPIMDRAAQFSPFAALTGYEAQIGETARLTQKKVELDENRKLELDGLLRFISENLSSLGDVSITYFVPDERKDGGSYATAIGAVKRIDPVEGTVCFKSGEIVRIEEIFAINGAGLPEITMP